MDEERPPNDKKREGSDKSVGRVRRAEPSTRTSNRFPKRRDAFRAKVGTLGLDIGTNSNVEVPLPAKKKFLDKNHPAVALYKVRSDIHCQ